MPSADLSDLDECAPEMNSCNMNMSLCMNTVGSYFCSCVDGFYMSNGSCSGFYSCFLTIAYTDKASADGTISSAFPHLTLCFLIVPSLSLPFLSLSFLNFTCLILHDLIFPYDIFPYHTYLAFPYRSLLS